MRGRHPGDRAAPDIAREQGVLDQVLFTGRRGRDALPSLYCAADVFVTTPWYEPFGITPVEAMACQIPVIGAAVGGVKYTVVDGKTGFLVPPKDADALADRLAVLAQRPELAVAMGGKGSAALGSCSPGAGWLRRWPSCTNRSCRSRPKTACVWAPPVRRCDAPAAARTALTA